jgi:hypothetical protein
VVVTDTRRLAALLPEDDDGAPPTGAPLFVGPVSEDQDDPNALADPTAPLADPAALLDQTLRAGFGLAPAETPGAVAEAAPPEPAEDDLGDPSEPPLTEEEQRDLAARALSAIYGEAFPRVKALRGMQVTDDDWVQFCRALWERHRPGVAPALRTAALHRLFRHGRQWVSWRGGDWREPPAPKDEARVVHNMIRPALKLRAQIVSEQRPGFALTPTKQTPEAEKKAEAQKRALEQLFDASRMPHVIKEAAYWNGPDGVAFFHVYFDPEAGPWDELTPGRRERLGDLRTTVRRIEEVRVSANATSTVAPDYWVVRRTLSLAEAVARYGPRVVRTRPPGLGDWGDVGMSDLSLPAGGTTAIVADTRTGVSPTQLLADQDTVECYHVYGEPTEAVPEGVEVVVVGDALVFEGPLQWGVVPLVRVPDGSEDPAFYPIPDMADWVDHQKRVNALVSKVIENVRVNAHGRLLARPGAIKQETLIGGVLSLLEVNHGQSVADAVTPIPPFSIAADVLEQIKFEVQAFEQKSGWNDATRGSFDAGESGRSILAQRETVERAFAPMVAAMADGLVQWAKVCLAGMRHHYDLPRWVGATGGNRPDLAMEVSADDFDGVADVTVDPETMVPLPRSMRLFLLDQMLEKGIITAEEYRQRLPFAYTGSIETPKTRKAARARRIALAVKRGLPVPEIRWTDDEGIIQSVLEEEILDVDKDDNPQWPQVIALATQVWTQYAMQAAQKAGRMPMGGAPGAAPNVPDGPQLDATQQPLALNNPGVAAAPAGVMAAESDEDAARAQDGLLGM